MKRLRLQAGSTQPKLETKVQFHFSDSQDTKLFMFPLSHDIWLSVRFSNIRISHAGWEFPTFMESLRCPG